jgi:hypothetical protein
MTDQTDRGSRSFKAISMKTLACLLLMTLLPVAAFAKRGASRPYVRSYLDGAFYVKAVPGGHTAVLQVEAAADRVIDTYPWFSDDPAAVELAWSPVVGKVAVARLVVAADASGRTKWPGETVAGLELYLGGAALKTYSASDLERLVGGRPPSLSTLASVLAVRQVPSTNDYMFVLKLPGLKERAFDVVTGEPVKRD